ncbi:DNA repair protein RecN [Candidatus Gracilibacteria bacterium]|nr:DNA repair protein RecN [Candidatus Gracilibacteria bacterium]
MLLELQISDFAIIDRLRLQLEAGFNVLTGETGAGKSIIIDALGTLRGEKTDPTFVRAGCSRARVEGVFSLSDRPDLVGVLQEYGLYEEGDEQIILTREISGESGRSVARINGRPVNTAALREVGGRLVDIHGQHEGLSLFNTRTHLDMLDRFGELLPLREQVSAIVTELRQVREELAEMRRNEARRQDRIEELRFLVEDVTAAKLQPSEEEELLRERTMVQNAARIIGLVNESYGLLYQGDEEGRRSARPIVETMAKVLTNLEELERYDSGIGAMTMSARELHYQLEDLATALRGYRSTLDGDPARLDEIEDRLTVLRDLQRKYGASVAEIMARAVGASAEIEKLLNSAEFMATLEQREHVLLTQLGQHAGEVSERRRKVGEQLAQLIERAMGDLAMRNVRFAVQIAQQEDAQGAPIGARRVAFDRTGVDQIEFMISPNPGEPLKPLARVASGGESARLLLALKSILSRVDEVPTLVFDEIDVGVGGRAGQVVGQKLWGISDTHQVLCITHLPQVAAFADAHFHISKEFSADRTRTNVRPLDEGERVDELASMLDGTPSEHSRANAREIVERANSFKREKKRCTCTDIFRTVVSKWPVETQPAASLRAMLCDATPGRTTGVPCVDQM